MGYEIEFFPVGEASKAGDAIVVRYGWDQRYVVMVIDGGTDASGEAVVNHVRNVFGQGTVVSAVISTHPDGDHACGLRHVLRELPVAQLWIHGLWSHSSAILPLFEDRTLTADKLSQKIKREYPIVSELLEIAASKAIEVHEPFAGQMIGPFRVLSPTKYAYQHLVPQFRKTPEPDVEALKAKSMWIGKTLQPSILGGLLEKAIDWIPETWDYELLKDGAVTAAENESSLVLFGDFIDGKVLLTSDAGGNALRWSCDYADSKSIDLLKVGLVQIPHHGSRSNVGPTVLNRLVGPKLIAGSGSTRFAVVSAPKDDSKHPRKMVLNAFKRRGAAIRSTQGIRFRYYSDMPDRDGERAAEDLPFYSSVEAYD